MGLMRLMRLIGLIGLIGLAVSESSQNLKLIPNFTERGEVALP